MNASALHIFTLGVKFGAKQSKLGMEIESQTDERLAEILLEGFKEHQKEMEIYSKVQSTKSDIVDWYAQHWTAQQAYRFGVMAGFDQFPKTPCDKKGRIILTEEIIDILTQLQFRSTKEIEAGDYEQRKKPYIKKR